MPGHRDMALNLVEAVRGDHRQRILLSDDKSGHQRGRQFGHLDGGRSRPEALDHRYPQIQRHGPERLARQIVRRLHFEVRRDMARAAIDATDNPHAALFDQLFVDLLQCRRCCRVGRGQRMCAIAIDKGRVEDRHLGHDLGQRGKIMVSHLDRAHLNAADHLGHAAQLAGREDLHGHGAVGRGGDLFGGLGGIAGLDITLGADMGVTQILCVCRNGGQCDGCDGQQPPGLDEHDCPLPGMVQLICVAEVPR